VRVALIVLGLVLIGAGAAIWFGLINYPSEHEVVKVGNMSAMLTRERPVPQWLGGVTALTGLLIAALGTRYRR
jgi:hypothetical protein